MAIPLRPRRRGFLRPFGCGTFIKDYLLGKGPYGSGIIDPSAGAPQSDMFREYKEALLRATALDRATRMEERAARREKRSIDPGEIARLEAQLRARLPFKTSGSRYHSFVVYFSNLIRLGWVEPSGVEQPSAFQANYAPAPPRRFYRLTAAGAAAPASSWADPRAALYRKR